jgi:hypothetical protein
MRAVDATRGTAIADDVRVADTHWTRFWGLQFTRTLPQGQGLWIKPCRQVHMFWMRYPIDVVFLDDTHRVVGLTADLRPWRISPLVKAATSVLELPAGTIARTGLALGSQLTLSA